MASAAAKMPMPRRPGPPFSFSSRREACGFIGSPVTGLVLVTAETLMMFPPGPEGEPEYASSRELLVAFVKQPCVGRVRARSDVDADPQTAALSSGQSRAQPSARLTDTIRDAPSLPTCVLRIDFAITWTLSRLTTERAASPSARPTTTLTGMPRIFVVISAMITLSRYAYPASRVSSSTGRRPTGSGKRAHHISNCLKASWWLPGPLYWRRCDPGGGLAAPRCRDDGGRLWPFAPPLPRPGPGEWRRG